MIATIKNSASYDLESPQCPSPIGPQCIASQKERTERRRQTQPHKCTHRDNETPHHTKGCGTEGYNGAFVECVERKMCRQNTTACIESIPPYHPTPAHTLTSHPQTTPNRDKGVQGVTLATRKAVSQEQILQTFSGLILVKICGILQNEFEYGKMCTLHSSEKLKSLWNLKLEYL